MSSRSANVSPQVGADLNALFGEIAAAAAEAPLPSTPPGMQQDVQMFAMTPQPARSLIDQQIVEVEERLNQRIDKLIVDMNEWSAQLEQRIANLLDQRIQTCSAQMRQALQPQQMLHRPRKLPHWRLLRWMTRPRVL